MENTKPQTNTAPAAPVTAASAAAAPVTPAKAPATTSAPMPASRGIGNSPRMGGFGGGRDFKKNTGKRGSRPEKVKSEYDQRILNIRRVVRVVTGGRRFSFSVAIIIGNHKGSVGVGTGKGLDTALAIDKALKNARKNVIKVNLVKGNSIAHEVSLKYSSARIVIRPAEGRGIIAGSAIRDIFELAGISDVSAKIVSPSKNKLNIARATIMALAQLKPSKVVMTKAAPVAEIKPVAAKPAVAAKVAPKTK
jgi:small subunit ribosomal protein S5